MCSPGWSSPPRSTRRPMRSSCRSAPVATRPHARSDLRRKGLRLSLKPWNVQRATGCILAYVCGPASAGGTSTVTPFGTIELTVYPYECDAFGHLNQAALLTLLERARWDALARGPGTIRVPGGDVGLAVDVRGEGLPVLFVHGFPFDRTVWRHQLATLSRVRRIAPDFRGVGDSGAPPGADGYSLTRYADDLVAVLEAVGVRQAVLCGLSMGGYVIFELLRRHPERVKALILADTKPEPDSTEAKRGREELTQVAQRDGQDAVIERLLPRLLAAATQATQPEVAGQVREMAHRWSVPGLVGALRTLRDRPDSTDTLRDVRVPTLVLVGSEDQIAPPDTARAMAQLIPGAQCHVVPAAGHLAPLEQPLATSRVVADFLRAIP